MIRGSSCEIPMVSLVKCLSILCHPSLFHSTQTNNMNLPQLDHVCKEQEVSSAEIEAAYESKLGNYAKVCAANETQLGEKRDERATLEEACKKMELVWTQRFETLKQAELDAGLRLLDGLKQAKRDSHMKVRIIFRI